jgi:hypothetical protein
MDRLSRLLSWPKVALHTYTQPAINVGFEHVQHDPIISSTKASRHSNRRGMPIRTHKEYHLIQDRATIMRNNAPIRLPIPHLQPTTPPTSFIVNFIRVAAVLQSSPARCSQTNHHDALASDAILEAARSETHTRLPAGSVAIRDSAKQ